MIRSIEFNKNSCNEWFAELPDYIEEGGSYGDLQMIQGADLFLDFIGENKNRVKLTISDQPSVHLDRSLSYIGDGNYIDEVTDHRLWLCPVTIWLLGYYPEYIFYKIH